MNSNYYEEITNYYNSINQAQTQLQLPKQTLIQFQELADCIKILGNTLSYAENYAMKNGFKLEKPEYTYYDYYNASKNTEKSLYLIKFSAAINNLDIVWEYYISKYESEPLPESIKKEDIISKLKNYQLYMNEEEKEIYNDLIHVLERKPIQNVKKALKKLKGNGTMDPYKIITTFLPAGEKARQDREDSRNQYYNGEKKCLDLVVGKTEPCIGADFGNTNIESTSTAYNYPQEDNNNGCACSINVTLGTTNTGNPCSKIIIPSNINNGNTNYINQSHGNTNTLNPVNTNETSINKGNTSGDKRKKYFKLKTK